MARAQLLRNLPPTQTHVARQAQYDNELKTKTANVHMNMRH